MSKEDVLRHITEACKYAEDLDFSTPDVSFTKEFDKNIAELFEKLGNREVLSYAHFELSPDNVKFRASLREIFDQLVEFASLNFDNRLSFTENDPVVLHPLAMAVNMTGEELREKVEELRANNEELESITQKLDDQNKVLLETINEKEILFQEVHHRVKNNMQVISGLLHLQRMRAESSVTRNMLLESEQRIKSMALVHEMLYKTKDFSVVCLNEYSNSLIRHVSKALNEKVRISLHSVYESSFEIPVNIAINYGLLLNEIISNSYKHAFEENEEGQISIELKGEKDVINVKVSDSGQKEVDIESIKKSNTLGMKLIESLAIKLGDSPNFKQSSGLEIVLKINLR